ncbi:MAG: PilZ domain-containing protein [Nitrospirae bacterium]|nr:MAG: PilZ domain-containing protein [Nitrospirota bacterium]
MTERRRQKRKPVRYDIRYTVTDLQTTYASVVEAKGTIVDISPEGFGIITTYPLRKGHVITIRGDKSEGIPDYGMVRWSGKEKNLIRAGLSFG